MWGKAMPNSYSENRTLQDAPTCETNLTPPDSKVSIMKCQRCSYCRSILETLAKCSTNTSATVLGSDTVLPPTFSWDKTGGGAEYFLNTSILRTLLKTSVSGVRSEMDET
ncbi:hypothetical protein E2C01_050435 [Portunus trituberculatus]|uniref:Uncharacterized protein n=1 Tax=Portunus trituberculatus TaxID=210409 RepID=A0A5B7GGD8_PORTR|nr:hypothetical protein [Portunus trituberculatus]